MGWTWRQSILRQGASGSAARPSFVPSAIATGDRRMSADDRTLFANLRREREQLAKSKMPAADRAALQKLVDPAIIDAQTLVKMREALRKDMESYAAMAKTMTASLKTLHGKYSALYPHIRQADIALDTARKAKGADPAIARLKTAFENMSMTLLDFSPFQNIDGA
jgi:phage shock protein A